MKADPSAGIRGAVLNGSFVRSADVGGKLDGLYRRLLLTQAVL